MQRKVQGAPLEVSRVLQGASRLHLGFGHEADEEAPLQPRPDVLVPSDMPPLRVQAPFVYLQQTD